MSTLVTCFHIYTSISHLKCTLDLYHGGFSCVNEDGDYGKKPNAGNVGGTKKKRSRKKRT